MSQPVRRPMVLVACIAAAALYAVADPGGRLRANNSAAAIKWEYCSVISDFQGRINFRSPGKEIVDVPTWKEWRKKYDRSASCDSATEALNVLGTDGWELVARNEVVLPQSGAPTRVTWTFKRPK